MVITQISFSPLIHATDADFDMAENMGVPEWVEYELDPETIDDYLNGFDADNDGLDETRDLENNTDSVEAGIAVPASTNINQLPNKVAKMSVKNTCANNSTTTSKNDVYPQENSDVQNRLSDSIPEWATENIPLDDENQKQNGVDKTVTPSKRSTNPKRRAETPPKSLNNPSPESIVSLLNLFVPYDSMSFWSEKASVLTALHCIGATKEQANSWCNSTKFKDRWKAATKDTKNYDYGFLYNLISKRGGIKEYNDARENDFEYTPQTTSNAKPTPKTNTEIDKEEIFKGFLSLVNQFEPNDFSQKLEEAPYAQYKEIKGNEYGVFVANRDIELSDTQKIYNGCLIISMLDQVGGVTGFEYISNRINKKGKYGKYTVAGSVKTGSAYVFRGNNNHIFCESWTTARKANKSTGSTTYACFGADNIETIVKQLIDSGVNAKKIFLAYDADKRTEAWKLRKELNCKVFVPEAGDWDDYSVKECQQAFEKVIYWKPKHTGKNRRFFNQRYIGDVLGDIIDNNAIAILKSAMCTGKTYAVKLYIITFYKLHGRLPKLIYIAPLTRLNYQIVQDINELALGLTGNDYDYMSFYQDIKAEKNSDAKSNMLRCFATTLQSSVIISNHIVEQFDLMIVDEPESSAGMLASKKAVTNIMDVASTLRKLGEHCKSIIFLDADASYKTKNLARLFKPNTKANFYHNTFKSQQGFIFKAIYDTKSAETILISSVVDKLRNKGKHEIIPFFCFSKVGQEKIKRIIENELPETRILLINADTKEESEKLLENKDYVKNFDLIIYNTAMSTGVSFDQKNLFTEMYALALNTRDFIIINLYLQSSYRIRHPKKNTIIGNIPPNKYSNDFGGTTKEVWESFEVERKAALEFMQDNTVYQHSDINEWITNNKKIDDIERELDKKFYKIKMRRELIKRGFKVVKFDDEIKGINAKNIIDEINLEKAERKEELEKQYLSDTFIDKNEAGTLQMNKKLGLKLTVTEEAQLNKYHAVQSASMSFNEYKDLSGEEKLQIVTSRGSIKAACENKESASYTLKQNRDVANILTKYGENNPYSNAARLLENKSMLKKVKSIENNKDEYGFISANVFTSKVNKKFLVRHSAYLNKLGVRFNERMIKNTESNDGDKRALEVYRKVLKLFGYKLLREAQGRNEDDQHDNKKADALYEILTIDHIEKTLVRRKERNDTLIDMTKVINKKLKEKSLNEQALQDIEKESKSEGAYAIVKILDRKSNVSVKLSKMPSEHRQHYKEIMDSIEEQCRTKTEDYFLRASNQYQKNHGAALEKTEDYAKKIDMAYLGRRLGGIELKKNQYVTIKGCLNIIPADLHDWNIKCIRQLSQNNGIDYAIDVLEEEAEKHTK